MCYLGDREVGYYGGVNTYFSIDDSKSGKYILELSILSVYLFLFNFDLDLYIISGPKVVACLEQLDYC